MKEVEFILRYFILASIMLLVDLSAEAQYFNKRIDFMNWDRQEVGFSVELMQNGNYLVFHGGPNEVWDNLVIARSILSPNGEVLNEFYNSDQSGILYTGYSNTSAVVADGGYISAGSKSWFDDDLESVTTLCKYQEDGQLNWIRYYGDSVRQTLGRATVENFNTDLGIAGTINVLPVGNGDTDAFLMVTNSEGNELAFIEFGGDDVDEFLSISPTFDGGYILGGQTRSFGTFNKVDHYIVKTDSLGEEEWTRVMGTPRNDCPAGVIQTQDSNYVFCGCWNRYDETSTTPINSLYLAKLNSFGNPMWEKTYADSGQANNFRVVKELDNGRLIAGGMRDGGSTGVLVKTDADGNEIWYREYKHPASLPLEGAWHRLHDVIPDGEGGFVATGYIYAPPLDSIPGQDLWVFRTDSMGCLVPGCHLIDNVSVHEKEVLVQMYPNPVDDLLSVHIKTGPMPHGAQLELYDMQGRQQYTIGLNPGSTTYIVPMGHLSRGMYLLRCVTGSEVVWNGKVMKE